ncbi:thioesterase domain-containing protein, partial [Rhodococcus jostii]
APVTDTEHLIADITAQVLGLEDPVGLDDDFFALGGTSLSATRLVARIEAGILDTDTTQTPVVVPVRWVFEHRTVEALAAAVELAGSAGVTSADEGLEVLLPLRTGGDGPSLFCVHPIAGVSWRYAGLAAHLDPSWQIYGLQLPWLTETSVPISSIEELAHRYVTEIQEIDPTGPYRLLGWSAGGTIAAAMATELIERGYGVDRVIMLDAYASLPADDSDATGFLAAMLIVEGLVLDEHPSRQDVVAAVLDQWARPGGLLHGVEGDVVDRWCDAMLRTRSFLGAHTPARYAGKVLYVTAAAGAGGSSPGLDTWRPYLDGEVIERRIDCTHARMCDPDHLAVIARFIR